MEDTIKTKFDIGEKCFCLKHSYLWQVEIIGIKTEGFWQGKNFRPENKYKVKLLFDDGHFLDINHEYVLEEQLFKTKEEITIHLIPEDF